MGYPLEQLVGCCSFNWVLIRKLIFWWNLRSCNQAFCLSQKKSSYKKILNILEQQSPEKKKKKKKTRPEKQLPEKNSLTQHGPHPHQFTGLELLLRVDTTPTPHTNQDTTLQRWKPSFMISVCYLYPAISHRIPRTSPLFSEIFWTLKWRHCTIQGQTLGHILLRSGVALSQALYAVGSSILGTWTGHGNKHPQHVGAVGPSMVRLSVAPVSSKDKKMSQQKDQNKDRGLTDGRNPAPVDQLIGGLSHSSQAFQPSTVVQGRGLG